MEDKQCLCCLATTSLPIGRDMHMDGEQKENEETQTRK